MTTQQLTSILPAQLLLTQATPRDHRALARSHYRPRLGLASTLVRHVCEQCTTRYIEAFAVMGRVHPFFEKGGMIRQDQDGARSSAPVYYLFDRGAHSGVVTSGDHESQTRISVC